MLGEEGGDVLARAVGRVARQEEFALGGVDEARACGSVEETGEGRMECGVGVSVVGILPADRGVVLEPRFAKEPGAKLTRTQSHVIAPKELEADGCGATVFTFRVARDALPGIFVVAVFEGEKLGVDLAGGDAAEGEPSGEFCAKVEAKKAVAGVFVGGHGAGRDQVGDALVAVFGAAEVRVGGFGVGGPSGGVFEVEVGVEGFEEGRDGCFDRVGYLER